MVDTINEIRLILDRAELEDTCYFELLPGNYAGTCWNASSAFIAEALFDWLEPTILSVEPEFDHYSFITYHKSTWNRIMETLEQRAHSVRKAADLSELLAVLGLATESHCGPFTEDFHVARDRLASFLDELQAWIRDILKSEDSISILGM